MTHQKTPPPAHDDAGAGGGPTPEQAAWVRANVWPAWMRAMDDDYPEHGCFLFRMCYCEIGLCVACSENEPRHDLCLTRQHGGRSLGWDMAVWAWTKSRQPIDGRTVADVTVAGRSCRWRCPCGCWSKPLPEPTADEPVPPPAVRTPRPTRGLPALDGQGELFAGVGV